MEQADSRFLLYRRPVTENHHLSSPHFDHIRLHACPLPHCSFMECSDSAAYQSRFVYFDGSWSYHRSILHSPHSPELSHRTPRKSSDFALVDSSHPSHPPANREANAQHITSPQASYDPALGAAAQAVSVEADRAQEYGAGVDGFAMNSLPGDMKPADQGIKKTTRLGTSADGSQRSLDLGDVERGFGNRDFL